MSRHNLLSRLRRFRNDTSGMSAVEFAYCLPLMLLLFLGSFEYSQAVTAYRKVSLTTRAVTDLATRYKAISSADMGTVLNASAQVMAPFNSSGLTIVLTQFYVSAAGVATVNWSTTLNGTALLANTPVVLPAGVALPNSYVIRADVTYKYTPPIGYKISGSITMHDHLYMSPRSSASINYPSTTSS